MAKSGQAPKLSKAAMQKALALRRSGWTLARIAAEFDMHVSNISRQLRHAEAAGEHLPTARTGRPRKRPRAQGEAPPSPPAPRVTHAALEALSEQQLLELEPGVLGEVLFGVIGSEYLPALRRMIQHAIAELDMVRMRDAIKIELEIKQRLIAAIPPKPPDPREDPANVAARDRVRARIDELVERHSEELCASCAQRVRAA